MPRENQLPAVQRPSRSPRVMRQPTNPHNAPIQSRPPREGRPLPQAGELTPRLLPGALFHTIQVGRSSPLPKDQLTLILLPSRRQPSGAIPRNCQGLRSDMPAGATFIQAAEVKVVPAGQTKQYPNFYYRSQRHAWLLGLAVGYMSKQSHGRGQDRVPCTGPGVG